MSSKVYYHFILSFLKEIKDVKICYCSNEFYIGHQIFIIENNLDDKLISNADPNWENDKSLAKA